MNKYHQILEAAVIVFARKGLEKGKIADIALEAGIGKGTIYEYFRSKNEIFQAIEKNFFEHFKAAFKELKSQPKTPTEKLTDFIQIALGLFDEMDAAMLIVIELWAQAGRDLWHGSDNSLFVETYAYYREEIKALLKEGVKSGEFRAMDTEGVAILLLAFTDGLAWQFVLFRNDQEFRSKTQAAIKSFMRGILK
ncbi:MAG: TetR/AcrR family transcriptional regulator [Candidatus Neomarinimicrobiota bacterium]